MIKNLKVAYLAPEIPALSATFVYNEIFALEKRGIKTVPISIHYIQMKSKETKLLDLKNRTKVLYGQKKLTILRSMLATWAGYSQNVVSTFFMMMGDIFKSVKQGNFEPKLFFQFLMAHRVAHIMSEENCNHLHIHFAHVPTQIGMYAAKLSGIPFTFMAHANDIFQRELLLKDKVDRSKKAIMISNFNRNLFESKGANNSRLAIVRCGIDTQIKPRKSSTTLVKIGSLGRLVEKKGFDTLIDAVANLKDRSFILEIAGDGPLRNELEDKIKRHNLQNKIKLVGSVDHTDVYDWLNSLDLFVLACKEDENGDKDGIPVVLMEAINAGVPVVSTYISGIPELVQHKVSGLLANPGDSTDLSNILNKSFQNYQTLVKYADIAKKRIKQEFDEKINVDRLLDIFCEDNYVTE